MRSAKNQRKGTWSKTKLAKLGLVNKSLSKFLVAIPIEYLKVQAVLREFMRKAVAAADSKTQT